MAISFIKLLLARVKSKSPKFYVTLRWIAGILIFLTAMLLGIAEVNPFHFAAALDTQIIDICKQLGSALSGAFLITWTGTADPKLLEKPEED